MSKFKTYIHLTGGLGNQLFQLAFASSRSAGEIEVESTLGRPRLNSNEKPDYSDFVFPVEFGRLSPRAGDLGMKFLRRTVGFILRQGMEPRGIEKIPLFGWSTRFLGSIVLSCGFQKHLRVIQATDNGYCQLPNPNRSEFQIGYFQSYRWHEKLSPEKSFRHLKLKYQSDELLNFLTELQSKKSIMMHVRLGDYLNEPSFGVPQPEYYEQALNRIFANGIFNSIVLFSNDPPKAIEFIPIKFRNKVIIAPSFAGSAAETLEAMRHMNAYVIGNSSLSWWAAHLRYDETSEVYCPTPWFKHKPEPRDLIPNGWNRIQAWSD